MEYHFTLWRLAPPPLLPLFFWEFEGYLMMLCNFKIFAFGWAVPEEVPVLEWHAKRWACYSILENWGTMGRRQQFKGGSVEVRVTCTNSGFSFKELIKWSLISLNFYKLDWNWGNYMQRCSCQSSRFGCFNFDRILLLGWMYWQYLLTVWRLPPEFTTSLCRMVLYSCS